MPKPKQQTKQQTKQQIDEVPFTPMKQRALRAGDEWDDAMRIAEERGDNVSEMLRATLRRYVKRHSD